QPIEPIIIFKLPEGTGRTLVARIKKGQLPHTMDFIEDTWKELYPDHPFDYNFLDELFDNLYRQDIRTGKVVNIFSAFAIFIACLGLFGLASFSTSQRLKEIGIRRVMGASSLNITKLLVSNFLKWVALANIIALPLAWLASKKWLQGFAYKINLNVVTFILAALISIFAAIITVSFQSIKAAHSNPVDAIKYE
ncbi:MAG: FtsX-like permease family protein, partial [Candidatus Celaenobacter antarcticus]|nr:FtsX-like permease family protein [Candidatus Celaenobacter antarcticus]